MLKQKLKKYLVRISLFITGIFSASVARAQVLYGPPPSQNGMQTLYGTVPVTSSSVIQMLLLPVVVVVVIVVAIVLGVRALSKRKKK